MVLEKMVPEKNGPRKIGLRGTQKRKILGWASSIVWCVCGMLGCVFLFPCFGFVSDFWVCCRVLGFHRLITTQHSTKFFVSEFPGDQFSGDHFFGDHFPAYRYIHKVNVLVCDLVSVCGHFFIFFCPLIKLFWINKNSDWYELSVWILNIFLMNHFLNVAIESPPYQRLFWQLHYVCPWEKRKNQGERKANV